jgi:hypothetical protein
VDAASLSWFRIVFGVIMSVEIGRFFVHGWIGDHYLRSTLLFKYYGFDWVTPWPHGGLYLHFAAMGLLAVMVTLGLRYRLAIVGLFLGFAYVFLLDQARYLNQYYLALCVALILCFLPAGARFLAGRAAGAPVGLARGAPLVGSGVAVAVRGDVAPRGPRQDQPRLASRRAAGPLAVRARGPCDPRGPCSLCPA